MKGIAVVLVAFLFLPGSVYMLLASNFGALKGYLIAATAFFGFLVMLSAVWLFGLPGTTPLTGPKGIQPTFKSFTINDPEASTYDSVRDFQGGAGNGWEPAPEGEFEEGSPEATLKADLDTARQAAVSQLIEETNQNVEDSSEELDVTNLEAEVFYTVQDGTEVAAIVISPATPPEGSGLQRPDFAPKTTFAYRDPGNPYLPSILFLVASLVLFVVHMLLLGLAERRRPLGVTQTPAPEAERQPAGAGARR
ncbi:MAG TPA: hypothetical protein VHS79_01130 [Actinomycetes bacterium]|nr:hypothetical protein [Actinomycetes bacterium]